MVNQQTFVYHYDLSNGESGTYRSETAHDIKTAFEELEKIYFRRLLSVVSNDVRIYVRDHHGFLTPKLIH